MLAPTTSKPARGPFALAACARPGLLLAVAVSAYSVLAYWVLRPLHQWGVCQPVLGALQGLDAVLQAFAINLAPQIGVRSYHHTTPDIWLFGVVVNAAAYFLVGLVAAALWRRATRPRTRPAEAAAEPAAAEQMCSRRRFLTGGVSVLGAGAAAGLGYSLLIEPRRVEVTRLEVPIDGLPPELDRLRLVQLTDIHLGPWLSLDYLQHIVGTANDLQPDLVCLTGDYIHRSSAYMEPVARELGRLRPRVASVAVLGNHDWWEGANRMRAALEHHGIVLLDNTRQVLTPGRRLVRAAPTGLALCGVGDLWEDDQDYEAALDDLPATMPRLLLSHNPDVAEEEDFLRGRWRVDLTLSGHTHGGQVRFPLVGALVTNSRYGQKYAQGLVRGPACRVFVCRGVGVSGLPLRLGAPPEIAVLELRAGAG